MISPRATVQSVQYISPQTEVNAGLWTLFAGTTVFLGLRLGVKYTRRTGLWYDDYMLVLSWLVLMATNILISCEYATGYNNGNWNDRMHILINISSCGTLVGQACSKTALGITLLRISNRTQLAILGFCIVTMNIYMILKVFFTWAKYCGMADYQNWYRFQGPCINYTFEDRFKTGGQTYNIIMDFVFAAFPWWITWKLEMRRVEKIALCATMSLGMLIAIFTAVRTSWMNRPIMHVHDAYYMWRNGVSNVWYSAEVAGTIIVQCIPILRPLLRDIHTGLTSKRVGDTEDGQTITWRSRRSTLVEIKRGSTVMSSDESTKKGTEDIALTAIPEESWETVKECHSSSSLSETDQSTPTVPAGPLFGDSWRLSGSERTDIHSPRSGSWIEWEQHERRGLSPPPPRAANT